MCVCGYIYTYISFHNYVHYKLKAHSEDTIYASDLIRRDFNRVVREQQSCHVRATLGNELRTL